MVYPELYNDLENRKIATIWANVDDDALQWGLFSIVFVQFALYR